MKYFATSRPVIPMVVILVMLSVLLVAVTWAQDFPPEPDTGFEIEGNAGKLNLGLKNLFES